MLVVESCDGERQGCVRAAMAKKVAVGHEPVDHSGHLLGGPHAEKHIPVSPLTEFDGWIKDRHEGEIVFGRPSLADPLQCL